MQSRSPLSTQGSKTEREQTTETDGKLTAVGLVGVVLAVVVSVAAPQLECAAAVLALELVGFTRRRSACTAAEEKTARWRFV